MTYLEFLGRWYNLPWLAAIAVGVLLGLRRRLSGPARPPEVGEGDWREEEPTGPRTSTGIALVAAGVLGLTANGAIHDFRLGPIGARAPLVIPLALAAGWMFAWGAAQFRHRYAPPVRGVAFNRPGLAGREAVVLSAGLDPDGTGRARHRDQAGIAHIVRIHVDPDGTDDLVAPATVLRGQRVRLGEFDVRRGSYPIEPL